MNIFVYLFRSLPAGQLRREANYHRRHREDENLSLELRRQEDYSSYQRDQRQYLRSMNLTGIYIWLGTCYLN